MPRIKKKAKRPTKPAPSVPPIVVNEHGAEVLTLPEAAAYLRLPEESVRQLVVEQGLPARHLGEEWRFLNQAIESWLSTLYIKENKEGIWAAAGSWKDDPYIDDMLKEIDRRRGRPVTEE
jgi:excisionase family DNA binding protein